MTTKKATKCARLKNLAKARQKRLQDIQSETPDGNDVTLLPIPGPEVPGLSSQEGSMDLGRGTTNVLQSAREQALAAENPRKRAHVPHYPGKSERTMSRERLAWRKLEAQGFTTLPDFFRQKAEKEQREARLAALVAASAIPVRRSVQQIQYIQEEEEESESDSGPGAISGFTGGSCTLGVLTPSDSETQADGIHVKRGDAPPIPPEELEESEESSSSCETSSNSDDDESDDDKSDDDSECPPSKRM
ncbi:hypothetical protein EDB86DRAFT_2833165 [Lactarius hatsudake]|nr:hypothetical protein EDB86DRAFT_2833165 [Lactarius hatsudake]